jgi:hypothetical protein
MLLLVVGTATLDGLLAAWLALPFDRTVLDLHVAVWAFLLVWAASLGYLVYARVPWDVLGLGLYLVAGVLVAKPTLMLGVHLDAVPGGLEGRRAAVAAVGDLFLWELVAVVAAVALVLVGRWLRVRGERVRERRARQRAYRARTRRRRES